MTRRNIDRRAARAADERGFTLIEILISVTILSVIAVSFMGYFVAAMERSADNSHRVIAANLARLKAEEIKAALRLPPADGGPYRSGYERLAGAMGENSRYVVRRETAAGGGGAPHDAFDGLLEPFVPVDGHAEPISATVYGFQVELSNRYDDRPQLIRGANGTLFDFAAEAALIRMIVTVYWAAEEDGTPSRVKSVALDTYLVGE